RGPSPRRASPPVCSSCPVGSSPPAGSWCPAGSSPPAGSSCPAYGWPRVCPPEPRVRAPYCLCSSRRRHTRFSRDWSSDVCSSDLTPTEDRPGLLAIILNVFSSLGINLTWIESRPTKKKLGTYRFFIETAAGSEDDQLQRARSEERRVGKEWR